jgi:hypothetical protein
MSVAVFNPGNMKAEPALNGARKMQNPNLSHQSDMLGESTDRVESVPNASGCTAFAY